MNKFHRLLASILALLAASTASAEIFRCQSREGTTYQQIPCPDGAIADTVGIPVSYPDYTAERERLAAREAAMDARLLRRLEIESAERIARDNRIAREKEAQAVLALAQAQSQDSPVYAFGRPLRPMRHSARPAAVR
jgi:hypothetical protein